MPPTHYSGNAAHTCVGRVVRAVVTERSGSAANMCLSGIAATFTVFLLPTSILQSRAHMPLPCGARWSTTQRTLYGALSYYVCKVGLYSLF